MKFVALVEKNSRFESYFVKCFVNISLDKKYKVSNDGDFALATKLSLSKFNYKEKFCQDPDRTREDTIFKLWCF